MKALFDKVVLILILLGTYHIAHAEVRVVDDMGREIRLQQPAQRIISLAPHITELLFNAGASEQIKGTVSFSDYPEAAKKIPLIGSYNQFDMEAIAAKKPDLIIAWQEGNNMTRINEVMRLGVPVFINEPREFMDIPRSIENFGRLLGTEKQAQQSIKQFKSDFANLKRQNKNRQPVKVFYQVWDEPLYTVNDEHLISKVIRFCGGENVFADTPILSPQIGIESVLERNPKVIVAGMAEGREDWLDNWKKWTGIQAVREQHLYAINADLIVRHTPRILQGTQQMCQILDRVRDNDRAVSD